MRYGRRLRAASRGLLLAVALVACTPPPAAVPLDRDGFWQVVDAARGARTDVEASERLRRALQPLHDEQLVQFTQHFDQVMADADRGDVWAAGRLVNGGHATDDGFQYFREWLVAQGRERYERTLRDPDSLAEVEFVAAPERSRAEWEGIAVESVLLYESRSGKDIRDALPPPDPATRFQEPDWDYRDYTHERLASRLPRLWQRYGEDVRAWDAQFEE